PVDQVIPEDIVPTVNAADQHCLIRHALWLLGTRLRADFDSFTIDRLYDGHGVCVGRTGDYADRPVSILRAPVRKLRAPVSPFRSAGQLITACRSVYQGARSAYYRSGQSIPTCLSAKARDRAAPRRSADSPPARQSSFC